MHAKPRASPRVVVRSFGPASLAGVALIAVSTAGAAELPSRYNMAGLGGLATEIAGDGDAGITAASPAGDVDGDGLSDVVFRLANAATNPQGLKYDHVVVLYGFPDPPARVDPTGETVRKTVIRTPATISQVSNSYPVGVAGGQDVTGDGIPDVVAASPYEDAVEGPAILLVHGGALPAEVRGADVGTSVPGCRFYYGAGGWETPGEPFGAHVALSEDLDGDGRGEIVVWSRPGRGAIVVFGSDAFAPEVDISRVGSAVRGFRFDMSGSDHVLDHLRSVGDVDGDGLADLSIATTEPATYLVFGRVDFPDAFDESSLSFPAAVRFSLFKAMEASGRIGPGGRMGLLIRPENDWDGFNPARVWLVDGRKRGEFPGVVERTSFGELDPLAVFSEPYDYFGSTGVRGPDLTLARGKDLDGDGEPEIGLGSPPVTRREAPTVTAFGGTVYVLRGLPAHGQEVGAAEFAASGGAVIDGDQPEGYLGSSCFLLDDFDGDGSGDVLVLARNDDCMSAFTGGYDLKLWLVSGRVLEPSSDPAVGRVVPDHAATSGGEKVLIHGTGFTSEARVLFGETPSPSVERLAAGVLRAEVPPASVAGTAAVRVETSPGVVSAPHDILYERSLGLRLDDAPERVVTVGVASPQQHFARGVVAADVSGDGLSDLAMLWNHGTGTRLYLLFGQGRRGADGVLDDLAPPEGAILDFGPSVSGMRMTSGGDLDGDGADDLVIRLRIRDEGGATTFDGCVVIAGRASFPDGVPLEALERTTRIPSSAADLGIEAAVIVPDVSGDSLDDLVLTASVSGGHTLIHILKGAPAWLPAEVNIDTIPEESLGARLDIDINVARVAGTLGDFNGDGRNDLFFAGRGVFNEGAMVIAYGSPFLFGPGTVELTRGFFGDNGGLLIAGPTRWSGSTANAASAGDIDGDGDVDVFLYLDTYGTCTLAPRAGGGAIFDYWAAVSGGAPRPYSSHLDAFYTKTSCGFPDFVPAGPGVQAGVSYVQHSFAVELLGATAAAAGDFDGDGIDDLLLGAPGTGDPIETIDGSAYILRGAGDLESLGPVRFPGAGDRGIRLSAPEDASRPGRFVQGGFDWDSDGLSDVLIAGDDGRAWLVFGGAGEAEFLRGDSDGSGALELTDAVLTLMYLFRGGVDPPCLDATDSNDDGVVDITDPIHTLSFLFLGGPAPPEPYPDAGLDPTADPMRCLH